MSSKPPLPTVTDAAQISSWNRGAITTPFVMAPSCTKILTLSTSTKNGELRYVFGHSGNEYYDPACIPIGTKVASELGWATYYYSPAICPHSWTIAQNFTESDTWGFGSTRIFIGTATSAALCCPSGYSKGGYGNACWSSASKGQTLQYVAPYRNGTELIRGETKPIPIETDMKIYGDGVPIWWQDKDKEVLDSAARMTPSSAPESSGTLVAGASEGASGELPQDTNSSTPEHNQSSLPSSGLSTGAKIGLGVGIPLAILLGLALGYILFRRRMKRKMGAPAASKDTYEMGNGSGNVAGGGLMQRKEIARHELKSEPVYELDNDAGRKIELPAGRT